jgi:hypothetical protein
MPRTKKRTIKRKWAHVIKNPKGYIDPYKVVVGPSLTFHSWHTSRASAMKEVARINKVHGGYLEEI